jgi:hypothetical protein
MKAEELRAEHKDLQFMTDAWISDYQQTPFEKKIVKSFKPQRLDTWHYNKSKPKAPGAFPVLIVYGKEAGHLIWLKAKHASSGARAKGQKVSLAEKRKQLDKRRDKKACELVLAEIAKYVPDDFEDQPESYAGALAQKIDGWFRPAAALIIAHGCRGEEIALHEDFEKAVKQGLKDKVVDELYFSLIQQALDTCRRRLSDMIKYKETSAAAVKLAGEICAIWGWNWKALQQAAVEACPEPKSWADEAKGAKSKTKPAKKETKARKPEPEEEEIEEDEQDFEDGEDE